MPRNGSGVYSLPSGNPVVTGTTISSTVQNNTTSDMATALTNSLAKDGQTTPTANLPLGGYKLTGVGLATASTDAATLANIQAGTGIYVATVGGTADVITLSPSPAITAYAAGQTFKFIASGANTTNVTVNVSGLGAKAITKNGTTALVAADIPSGMMVEITYDGTRFILESPIAIPAPTPPADVDVIILGTPQATTSGTAWTFGSIPADCVRVTVNFSGFSTNGTSVPIVQIGDAGGIEITGYVGSANNFDGGGIANLSDGFQLVTSHAAAQVLQGRLVLELLDAATFTWTCTGITGRSDTTGVYTVSGYKNLTAALTQVRLTTQNGTDVGDAGKVNIIYEIESQ